MPDARGHWMPGERDAARIGEGEAILVPEGTEGELARVQRERDEWMRKFRESRSPCQCDPPGSGEEYCNGVCYMKAERDAARAEAKAAQEQIARLNEFLRHRPTCAQERAYRAGNGYRACSCGLDAALEQAARLREALALAAIPLEVLYATEMGGKALCQEVKDGITDAVMTTRTALATTAPVQKEAGK